MTTLFWILAGTTFLQGLLSLGWGFVWLRYVRDKARRKSPSPEFLPPVTLIIPCCGSEPGLADHLTAYLSQDYPDYEVLFVTGGRQDSATAVIQSVVAGRAAAGRPPVRLICADPPVEEGDKVSKLRLAVRQGRTTSRVLAFGDSDGRPARRWLRHLVAPLADSAVGAATGYRWYLPRGELPSLLRSAWNSFIASVFGNHRSNFCWGGSMAVQRQTFAAARVEEFWRGSVSDDYQLTNAVRRAGLRIVFVPSCLVTSAQKCSWRELFSWTTRQIVITRVHARRLWALGLLSNAIYSATLVLGLALSAGWLLTPSRLSPSAPLASPLLALVVLPAMLKGWLRGLGAEAMLPEHAAELARWRWTYALLSSIVPLLMLYNFVVAGLTRRIEWRGVHYELLGPNQTRIRALAAL